MRGRKLSFAIVLSDGERSTLQHWLRSTTVPAGLVARARAILLLSEGMPLKDVMLHCNFTAKTVRKWAKRFIGEGLSGLADRPGRGGKPVFSP